MARLHEAHGDLDGALELLAEAQPAFMIDLSPNLRPIAAVRARLLIRQGQAGEALRWAGERGLSVDDELSYVHEYEHITLARAQVASGLVVEAAALLNRLLEPAEDAGRYGSVVEILALQALAYETRRETAAALASLERALTLAEPEGYMRVFLDEGPRMATLLEGGAKRGLRPDYVQRLLKNFGAPVTEAHPGHQELIEPLSERELEVLRLLATDLDGPEIASELMVSLNTMRTHTKSIYTKLAVNSRRAAVRRAEELDLLSQTAAH
jgi:LuxR family maltose regulon positive regulatory protein